MLKGYLQKRIIVPVTKLLRQGISPEKIALSIAWGVMLGIFPVLGTTTILCTVAAVLLRLNLPVMQLANWLVYPLQIVLMVPFFAAGTALFGNTPFMKEAAEVIVLFRNDWFNALLLMWEVIVQAVLVWMLIAPAAIMLMYFVMKAFLKMLSPHGSPTDSPQ